MPFWKSKEEITARNIAHMLMNDWVLKKGLVSIIAEGWDKTGIVENDLEEYCTETLILIGFAIDSVVRSGFRKDAQICDSILEEVDALWEKWGENREAQGLSNIYPVYCDRMTIYRKISQKSEENVILNVSYEFGEICGGEPPEGDVLTKTAQIFNSAVTGINDVLGQIKKEFKIKR